MSGKTIIVPQGLINPNTTTVIEIPAETEHESVFVASTCALPDYEGMEPYPLGFKPQFQSSPQPRERDCSGRSRGSEKGVTRLSSQTSISNSGSENFSRSRSGRGSRSRSSASPSRVTKTTSKVTSYYDNSPSNSYVPREHNSQIDMTPDYDDFMCGGAIASSPVNADYSTDMVDSDMMDAGSASYNTDMSGEMNTTLFGEVVGGDIPRKRYYMTPSPVKRPGEVSVKKPWQMSYGSGSGNETSITTNTTIETDESSYDYSADSSAYSRSGGSHHSGQGNATYNPSCANATYNPACGNATFNPSGTYNPAQSFNRTRNATFAPGNATFAPGNATFAPGNATFAPGNATFAPGNATFAPGNATFAPGNATFDQGGNRTRNASYQMPTSGSIINCDATFNADGRGNTTVNVTRAANGTFGAGNGTFNTGANATYNGSCGANATYNGSGGGNATRNISSRSVAGVSYIQATPAHGNYNNTIAPSHAGTTHGQFNASGGNSTRNTSCNSSCSRSKHGRSNGTFDGTYNKSSSSDINRQLESMEAQERSLIEDDLRKMQKQRRKLFNDATR